jgi:hypothetical protein
MDRNGGIEMPRCRDCGTRALHARREVVTSGFRARVNLHFVCESCGLLQCVERQETVVRSPLKLVAQAWRH